MIMSNPSPNPNHLLVDLYINMNIVFGPNKCSLTWAAIVPIMTSL